MPFSKPMHAGCDVVGVGVEMIAVEGVVEIAVEIGARSISCGCPDVTVLMTSLMSGPGPPKSDGEDADDEDDGRSDERAPRERTFGPLRWRTSLYVHDNSAL